MTDTLEPSEVIDPNDPLLKQFSELSGHVQRMASTGQTGSMAEWCEFTAVLESALRQCVNINARPVVKALEWEDNADGSLAHAPNYTAYHVYSGAEDEWYASCDFVNLANCNGLSAIYESEETAKQACQDHFASLITQCLEPAAPVVSEEMIGRGARALHKHSFDRPWDKLSHNERELYRRDARLALTAALTPTEGGE